MSGLSLLLELHCPEAWGTSVHQQGIKPKSPVLGGRFLTSRPPGKPDWFPRDSLGLQRDQTSPS